MDAAVAEVLAADPRIAYGIVFGSAARGQAHRESDLDIAIGLASGESLVRREIGGLVADLEAATGWAVDLVLVAEAPPALAWRIFDEGRVVFDRDPARRRHDQARAALAWIDYRPLERRCVEGVLRAARGRQ